MYYSVIGIIAILIHLIINFDIYFRRQKNESVATRDYRRYLNTVLIFFLSDTAWGVMYTLKLTSLLYVSTVCYYISMTLSLLYWCKNVSSYVQLGRNPSRVLLGAGGLFCVINLIILIVNIFYPIYFWIGDDASFHSEGARYYVLIVQILLFTVVANLALVSSFKETNGKRVRLFMLYLYSSAMVITLVLQVVFPQYPLYTAGLMIGTCLLHVFVQEDERREFRKLLEANEVKLKETTEVIANTGYGIWKIRMDESGRNAMFANETLQKIFGVSDMGLTPEQLYTFYHGRLIENVANIEQDDYKSMAEGHVRSRVLKWVHPRKGQIYLHAGGTSYVQEDGAKIISGYCADVTEKRELELRSNLIINTLAESYEFMNYISIDEGSFITSSNTLYSADQDISKGRVENAIRFACEQRVAPEFRDEMVAFSDLSTIDKRMRHRRLIINQFKDLKGVWHEWSYIVADRGADGSIKHLIWAVRQIEDEKQAELRKQQLIEDNIAANKAKTVFLQNMSHEIRTPLNAMFGFSQLLGLPDGSWTDEEKQQYNEYIFNSYNMLDMLIGDIIDIADSEHGNYKIEISEVSVNSICWNSIKSVEYRVTGDVNLYYTSDVPDEHVIKTDGRRVQQVLINFLTNACKHTQKGEIHLHCSTNEHPGKLTFSVTDTGTGVPAEKADLIFNRFTKLDSFTQGSGLGLNICMIVADKLGGEVYLDKSYTDGARFVFVIDNK